MADVYATSSVRTAADTTLRSPGGRDVGGGMGGMPLSPACWGEGARATCAIWTGGPLGGGRGAGPYDGENAGFGGSPGIVYESLQEVQTPFAS